jgi:hypothetical protein
MYSIQLRTTLLKIIPNLDFVEFNFDHLLCPFYFILILYILIVHSGVIKLVPVHLVIISARVINYLKIKRLAQYRNGTKILNSLLDNLKTLLTRVLNSMMNQ